MIENILLNLGVPVYPFIRDWTITFRSLDDVDPSFFDHIDTTDGQKINVGMPSGFTGDHTIDLWLHANDGRLYKQENGAIIQKEVAHAVLFGTPDFVTGVHDNDKSFLISFWYWNRIFWSRFYMRIVDIRDLVPPR